MNDQTDWNKDNIEECLSNAEGYYEEAFDHIVSLLNDYQNLYNDKDYYQLLLGDWLIQFIHQTYLKWINKENYYFIDNKIIFSIATSIEEFNTYRLTKVFNDNLENIIYNYINSEDLSLIQLKHFNKRQNNHQTSISLTPFKNLINNSIFNQKNKKIVLFQYLRRNSNYQFYSKAIKWKKWIGLKSSIPYEYSNDQIDFKWRKQNLPYDKNNINFLNLLKILLPLLIPNSLLESFKINRTSILNLNPVRPGYLYSASGLYQQHNKLLFAEWKKSGTKLLYHQHGGNYGLDAKHALEEYEMSSVNRYYTWGWCKKSKNVFSLPVPSIKVNKEKLTRILLCVTDYYSLGHRIHYQPMGNRIIEMHNQTLRFLEKIKSHLPLDLRLPQKEYDYSIASILKSTPNLRSIDKTSTRKYNMPLSYSHGNSIVVHSYLCTSWLETMGLDIPTVCFYDPEVYKFRHNAHISIEKLERVGILHKSGQDAANFINDLKNNIEEWWSSSETMDARSCFKKNYANFSNNWHVNWEKEFRSLID